MFKIGEFSKLTQVSIRMLRYYDEVGLLKPARIDDFTGYRYYSVDQIPLLHKIIFFRDTGFQVSEIAAALKNCDGSAMIAALNAKQREIEAAISQEQERLKKIEIAIKDVNSEGLSIRYNISLKTIPTYPVLSLRKNIPDYFAEGMLWKEMEGFVKAHSIEMTPNDMTFAIYHDMDFKDADVDVEVCAVVNQLGKSRGDFTYRMTEAVETMACAMVYGPYENIGPAYEAFAHWLTQHDQYKMIGHSRQICHCGPWNEKDPLQYLTEIQIPVEK